MDTDTIYAGVYWGGLFHSTDGGANWGRVEVPLGRLSSLSLSITKMPDRTILNAGVVGGVVDLAGARLPVASLPDLQGEASLYGSGVYQLTLDHRQDSLLVFLPVTLKN